MSRSVNRLAVGLAALVLVTGCGDKGESFTTVEDLAAAIGCDGAPIEAEPQFFTESGFSCTVKFGDVNAYWFADTDALRTWEQVGLDAMAAWSGESEWPRLIGDRWAIEGSRTNLEFLRLSVGGVVRDD